MSHATLILVLVLALALASGLATTASADSDSVHAHTTRDEHEPPEPLFSALGWRDCVPEHVHHPESTDEVADLVVLLYSDKRATGRGYRFRTAHDNFYTHNNLSCTDMGASSSVPIVIDMTNMDRVLSMDKAAGLVTVQAGMTFQSLVEYLLTHGLGLPGWSVMPQFAGMPLGAALEAGAHGSSLDGPASIAEYLETATLVDGTGQVLVLESPGNLLEGSLGLLGVTTELVMRVLPARKAAIREVVQEDLHMLEDMRELIEKSDAVSLDISWSPAASLFSARIWHEAPPQTDGDATNVGIAAPTEWLDGAEGLLQQDQEDQEASAAGYDIMCEVIGDVTGYPAFMHSSDPLEALAASSTRTAAFDDGMFVGWSGRLSGARCSSIAGDGHCAWTSAKLTPHAFAIPSDALADWVDDVRAVVATSAACPSFLVTMRFVMERGAPLAPSAGRQVVAINLESWSSRHYDGVLPHKQQFLLDEVLQLSLCKYGARPHWALSTNRMLASACPLRRAYGAGFDVFAARRARYDPLGLFLHPLYSRVEDGLPAEPYPGCVLKEDCFCSEDAHCGPGFACVPGGAFPEYRVCRMWGNENPEVEL